MAKMKMKIKETKSRDILGMQLGMLEKVLKEDYHGMQPMTRKASGKIVTDPHTGKSYKVVG